MVKKTTAGGAAGPAQSYDPDAQYRVRLTVPMSRGGLKFLPRHEHQMSGAFLIELAKENADAIGFAERI